jgi:hypothetical protein
MLHSFEKENVVGEYHVPFFVRRRYRTYRYGSANADCTEDQATKVSSIYLGILYISPKTTRAPVFQNDWIGI